MAKAATSLSLAAPDSWLTPRRFRLRPLPVHRSGLFISPVPFLQSSSKGGQEACYVRIREQIRVLCEVGVFHEQKEQCAHQ